MLCPTHCASDVLEHIASGTNYASLRRPRTKIRTQLNPESKDPKTLTHPLSWDCAAEMREGGVRSRRPDDMRRVRRYVGNACGVTASARDSTPHSHTYCIVKREANKVFACTG
jgi:hypothetical protein